LDRSEIDTFQLTLSLAEMEYHRLPNLQVSVSSNSKRTNLQSKSWLYLILPGSSLCISLAWLACFLQRLPQLNIFSSMILAIALGIIVRNTIGVTQIYEPGIRFVLRRLLRVAITLLGLQLSLTQMIEIGVRGVAIVVITLLSTFCFTCWLGKQLGIQQNLTQLIAAGTSICGASAVIATNAVIHSSDEDAAYAVATVTVFGTLSMFLYPLLSILLHLTPQAFGIWCGVSIHEVAQVIAAAFQAGISSGQLATVAKLSRVLLLAPMILILGRVSLKTSQTDDRRLQTPIPWFVLGFIGFVGLNSLDILPTHEKSIVITANQFLLTAAIAAMGLETKLHKIVQAGFKPLYLAAASWAFISVFSLILAVMFYK
jgi:uncharacterized integral membrane protein (TIGR00698 family)